MDPKLRTKELDSNRELMLKHAKGLDEITFNLQESQVSPSSLHPSTLYIDYIAHFLF